MEIKVLGTGCAKCKKLYALAEQALTMAGMSASLEKVERIDEIMKYKVMMTPALVIAGEVKCAGRLPKPEEIAQWIITAAAREETA